MPGQRRPAFTIIELLVVIAILTLLMAIALPAIQRVRAAWHKAACASNLRQIGTCLLSYLNDHGKLPTGGGDLEEPGSVDWDNFQASPVIPPIPRVRSHHTPSVGDHGSIKANGAPAIGSDQDWGWAYQILPYLGSSESNLYHLPNSEDSRIARTIVDVYFCPARWGSKTNVGDESPLPHPDLWKGRAKIDYAGNLGTNDVIDIRPNRMPVLCWRPDKNNFGNREGMDPASLPPYRNGVFIKGRFWAALPAPPWSKFTYVDWPLGRNDIKDGFSHTLAIAEKAVSNVRGVSLGWTSGYGMETLRCGSYWMPPGPPYRLIPHDRPYHDREVIEGKYTAFGSAHPHSMNALFLDGSVRQISYSIQPDFATLPVHHPRMEATENPNQLSLFRRLLHRSDGGHIDFVKLHMD